MIAPRSSAISGSSPSSRRARVERRRARARGASAAARVARARRDRPVGDEAAEMVDADEIEERERAPQPLDPPAVAAAPQRRPVVERVAPPLARAAKASGGAPAHGAALEELAGGRGGRRSPARRRAAGRRSARTPRSAAYARSAVHSRSKRTWSRPRARPPASRAQSSIQNDSRARNAVLLGARDRRRADRRAARGSTRTPSAAGRGSRAVGRAERQHLPPRLAGGGEPVDERVGVAAEPPEGSEVMCSCTPLERERFERRCSAAARRRVV